MMCDYCGVKKFCYAHGATEYVPDFASDLQEEN